MPSVLRLAADRRGTTALEFAVAGTTIMILLLAVFDVGLLFMSKRGLDYGIYRAARWASVNKATASVATVTNQFKLAAGSSLQNAAGCQGYAAGSSAPAGAQCSVSVGFSNGTSVGSFVTVQANYRWSPVSPVDGLKLIQLQSRITLAIQH